MVEPSISAYSSTNIEISESDVVERVVAEQTEAFNKQKEEEMLDGS